MTKKQYLNKLHKVYPDIPEDKQAKAENLMDRLADVFMMMDECKEHIAQEGCVTEMDQGKYSIMRENPYSKVYDAKYKLMLSTVEKLDKMSASGGLQKDELEAFLSEN